MRSKVRVLVIDDEFMARRRVVSLLSDIKEIELIKECGTGREAIEIIINETPDLIFLDIEMKDMSGFDVLSNINPESWPFTIFITAHANFALKAFEHFAFDYLLKPFKDDRFYHSINKALELINSKKQLELNNRFDDLIDVMKSSNSSFSELVKAKLPVKTKGKIIFLEKINIKYIEAFGNYAEIYCEDKKHVIREPLSQIILELDTKAFVRIHRSTIININFMKELFTSSHGEFDVRMDDNKIFRISRSYRKALLDLLGL